MKDLGDASYILSIKIYRDRSRRILGMTQASYIKKVLKRLKMENSKRGFLPIRYGVKLSITQSPKTNEMCDIPYASIVAIYCIKHVLVKHTRLSSRSSLSTWKDSRDVLGVRRWKVGTGRDSNPSFQLDIDNSKSQSDFVLELNGGVVAWKSSN
ncbi:UNVERIFIED_CONTAM: hypothetical protein Slati_3769200 [Sesamum latifolium]|uniref:Retrovirus-related Pol polyprotein from transposon TNT 1-94 n=1 Tax=Sesamum latifolium TaxID=2727402 RepID=A0AAW2U659_9LAMI